MNFFGNEKYYFDRKNFMEEISLFTMFSCAFGLVSCTLGRERKGPSSERSKIL